MRIQPRLDRGHRSLGKSLFNPAVEAAVARDCIRWNTSRSWIIHTALAAFYGVDIITPMKAKTRVRLVKGRRRRAA